MKSSDDRVIKAGLLIALGVGAFKVLHRDIASVAEHWIEVLNLDPGNRFIDVVLTKASNVNPDQVKKLGLGSFVYAGLFLTEGIGLWLLNRWAEWLTVIITSSLIPFEIYEIHRRLTLAKVGVLVVNAAIVVYLICRIRRPRPGSR
jgi:uncharacterized membrane protein (DUF2068 family)